eukprot:scaffold9192_cov151-Skeletonema_marinoi.AAC.1
MVIRSERVKSLHRRMIGPGKGVVLMCGRITPHMGRIPIPTLIKAVKEAAGTHNNNIFTMKQQPTT